MIKINWNKIKQSLIHEYRRRKPIYDTPSFDELSEAIDSYKIILNDAESGEPIALRLLNNLASYSHEIDDQIKMLGALFEIFDKYPHGVVPKSGITNISEKWNIPDHIVTALLRIIGQKVGKVHGKIYLTDEEIWDIIKDEYNHVFWKIIDEHKVIEHIDEIEECLDKLELRTMVDFCLCLKRQPNIDIKWANKLCAEFYMLDNVINKYYDKILERTLRGYNEH